MHKPGVDFSHKVELSYGQKKEMKYSYVRPELAYYCLWEGKMGQPLKDWGSVYWS